MNGGEERKTAAIGDIAQVELISEKKSVTALCCHACVDDGRCATEPLGQIPRS